MTTRKHLHAFKFETVSADGRIHRFAPKAKVMTPRRGVRLIVTAADVQRSILARGAGNTMNCTMAVCVQRLEDLFPHPVTGIVDWFVSRAYVVSKNGADGLPAVCYAYRHYDTIADMNDSPAGQRALLRRIEDAGGSIAIDLKPFSSRAGMSPPDRTDGRGRRDGSRSTSAALSNGSKRRLATLLGGEFAGALIAARRS